MAIVPVTLSGRFVRLEPLSPAHLDGLASVGLDADLWRWIPTPVTTREDMREYIMTALREFERGVALPFAIVHRPSGAVIGSTRFANIVMEHKRLEIGWTWLALAHQRTPANTEAKLLLLTHAFDVLGVNRVELKTDVLNTRSRAAIRRLGAVEEGIFRRHVITSSGRVRDTVYYSIVDSEWPRVRDTLSNILAVKRVWAGNAP